MDQFVAMMLTPTFKYIVSQVSACRDEYTYIVVHCSGRVSTIVNAYQRSHASQGHWKQLQSGQARVGVRCGERRTKLLALAC